MARLDIDIGVEGNDGTGDSIRESFRKVNANFNELYAVFGIGGQISFTDLGDVPDTYEGNENKVPVVRANATGISFLELASDNALTGQEDTIGFDFSQQGKLVIRQLSSRVSNDPQPVLAGPLNAATQPIGNIRVDQTSVETFNSIYGTNITIDDLVIDKKFADRNYQEKAVAGGGIRLADEPAGTEQYSKSTTVITLGNLIINNHGLTEAFNGAAFVFNSSGTDPFGVISGNTYFIRIAGPNTISLYNSEANALNNQNRILLSGGSGTFTITDAAFDPSLQGNWLSNVAIPRKSIVRRQGDSMEGALDLFDHPGLLSGIGLPNGPDDLQAATKLYVDSVSTTSQVNLFVRTNGTDRQEFTPFGLEGRSPAYAFKTVNAACRRAEEIMLASSFEPGPYMQTMTFNNGESTARTNAIGILSPIAGRNNARTLIVENREFIKREVIGFINFTFPDFAYDQNICARDIGFILDSVSLDALLGDNANYLSRYAGLRYYSSPSARRAIGEQRVETLAGIEYARNLVVNFILANTPVGTLGSTLFQTRVNQFIEPAFQPDNLADNVISAKFDVIVDLINNGPLSAPTIIDGQTTYKINVGNGNFGFVDQANPQNTDIIPGKVVRGRSSGAIGRIINYKYEAGPEAVTVPETDEIEIQLLEPIEFQLGEELEYGNIVPTTQVTVNVESGTYLEDYPIRVPVNTSINGDEFRRVLIRPKKRVSQSRYANTFFFRDAEFDGLILGKTRIEEFEVLNPFDTARADGTYTVTNVDYVTSELGERAVFEIEINNGLVISANLVDGGRNFQKNEIINVSGSVFGSTSSLNIRVTKVPNGVEYVNPLTRNVDGYFGYHYLKNPDQLRNVGAGYTNVGKWETAALALLDNRDFIGEQVANFMENQFPALIGVYDRQKSIRDAKIVVESLATDLRNGGNEFSLEAQGSYADGAVDSTKVECETGLDYIFTIAQKLLLGQAPDTIYGTNLQFPQPDLFNGAADPDNWTSGQLYRVGDVVRFFVGGIFRYYQSKIEHVSGIVFDAGEITARWNEIPGPTTTVRNLLDTVIFAFNPDYNPPLRNEDMDVFLMNDATILRNITVQGHGGFMCVLDPEGQILTKSPYIQTGSSFSQSINKQDFRGGMYVDAFTGNSAVQVIEKIDGSPFKLRIRSLGSQAEPQGLFIRRPQTPCPFFIDGRRFQVNAVTEYDPDFGTAVLILDQNSNNGQGFTGITSNFETGVNLDAIGTFEFNEDTCARDTRLILEAVSLDLALGTNFASIYSGLAYRRSTASLVLSDQLSRTVGALNVARDTILGLSSIDAEQNGSSSIENDITGAFAEITGILEIANPADAVEPGQGLVSAIAWSDPGINVNRRYARELLQLNRAYIKTELETWVQLQITNQTPPFNTPSVQFLLNDFSTCARDAGYIVDAFSFDIQYGGNYATRLAAQAYFSYSNSILPADQFAATAAAIERLGEICDEIVRGVYVGQAQLQPVNTATSTEGDRIIDLAEIISDVILANTLGVLPTLDEPDFSQVSLDLIDARNQISLNTRVIVNRALQSIDSPLPITLQTAGNRSMLGNDFTQINDLGYGLVVNNGGLSEMVSMFTYYCHASYYSKNGAEIRSITGSTCYGEFGLVAEGSDPNEIPEQMFLVEDMVQPGKTFSASTILYLNGPINVTSGQTIFQTGSEARGTVSLSSGTNGNNVLYLENSSGIFNLTQQLNLLIETDIVFANTTNPVTVTVSNLSGLNNGDQILILNVFGMSQLNGNSYFIGNIDTNTNTFELYSDSGLTAPVDGTGFNPYVFGGIVRSTTSLGPNSVPYEIDPSGYLNLRESLSIYVYDFKDPPSNRSEFDVLHPIRNILARYEVANAERINAYIGRYKSVNGIIPTTETTVAGTGARFSVYKTISDGYTVEIENGGTNYQIGDTFDVAGSLLGGDTSNDATITVTGVDNGVITDVEIIGIIFVDSNTPAYSGQVYKLNFATGDAQFSSSGLLEIVGFNSLINYRRNQTHILGDLQAPDVLTIRPSTAVVFNENLDQVYRSISFLTSNSIGDELEDNQVQAGFDSSYDYIRVIVNNTRAVESSFAGTGTTMGATAGDVVIALEPSADLNEIFRLNNNLRTPIVNRPIGWSLETLAEAPIFSWGGKKHYMFNYRGVNIINGTPTIVEPSEDNDYAIVSIQDVGEEINFPATPAGLSQSIALPQITNTIRAGLRAGATGDVTINISTCRATAHDFLNVGTGSFNQSNYPNVIFGLPREKNQANEVAERGKGRVFYVSTDQDGIFRVGRFFNVDQGTGTVTFSANIALSDVDGLGFKRGVVVTEFSTDTAMTDNATDTVPTESAVRGYVNRRLGYDQNGTPVTNIIGPGVLAPNGAVPMTDNLNAAGNTITNLRAPLTSSDAATKLYVDQSIGANNTLPSFRDTEINDYAANQLLVSTGFKKIVLLAGSILSGPFTRGTTFTGSISGATGIIRDIKTDVGFEGNIVFITYTPQSGTIQLNETIFVTGGPQGLVIDGPIDEWANGVWNPNADIEFTATRIESPSTGTILSRNVDLNVQIKADTIVNADVNTNAGILQSKLSMNSAGTRGDALGITQNDLGLAVFNNSQFSATNGWIELQTASSNITGVTLNKLQHINSNTALARSAAGVGAVSQVSFSDIVDLGNGLQDGDFTAVIPSTEPAGQVLVKRATGQATPYALSNITVSGQANSIVKTRANGSIQVNSIILGGDETFEVLSLATTTLNLKTPAQGLILTATGGTGGVTPTFPVVQIPGSLRVGTTGVGQSTLQSTSNFNNRSRLGVDWIYSGFIEAPGERGAASTGIAIGADTGLTTAGQVGIVTRNTATNNSVVPALFSSTGFRPDITELYNIGTSSFKYNTVHALLFRGTALEAFYADLAENYLADQEYEPGTVLVFGGEFELTTTDQKGDRKVAGVVSTEPATLMNSALEGEFVTPLALQGRVPCKVIGRVEKGDLLVTSATPGYAIVNNDPKVGTVIGKALENKTDDSKGIIEVVVGKH
jgi:hypothetical protein